MLRWCGNGGADRVVDLTVHHHDLHLAVAAAALHQVRALDVVLAWTLDPNFKAQQIVIGYESESYLLMTERRGLAAFLGLSGASEVGLGAGSRDTGVAGCVTGAMTTVRRCDSFTNFSDTFRPRNRQPY